MTDEQLTDEEVEDITALMEMPLHAVITLLGPRRAAVVCLTFAQGDRKMVNCAIADLITDGAFR